MILNATLLVQGLHFGLVCWILSRFFFRPILQHLHDANQHEHYIKQLIKNGHNHLRVGYLERQAIWQAMQQQMMKNDEFRHQIWNEPVASDVGVGLDVQLVSVVDLAERDRLVQKLINQIISKDKVG